MRSPTPVRTPPTGAAARQGEVRSNTIPYLFHGLHHERATGVLTVSDGEVSKRVQWSDGRVLFASSNQREDRLSQHLIRSDALPLKDIMKALEVMVVTKDRLGEVMVRYKMMTAEQVDSWVRRQVHDIACSLFVWTRGRYAFEAKPAGAESITLGLPGDRVVIDGVMRITSWARAYEEIGSLNTELRTTAETPAIVSGLALEVDHAALLAQCEAPRSLEEICEGSQMTDYDVCKLVWAFLIIGALMKA